MKIMMLTRSRFPSERAESMTTIYTAEALAKEGCQVEVLFRSERTFLEPITASYLNNPIDFYGIDSSIIDNGLLRITKIPAPWFLLELIYRLSESFQRKLLEKIYFLAYNSVLLLYVFIKSIFNKPDVIYLRTTSIAFFLLLLKPIIKAKIVYEAHNLSNIPPTHKERVVINRVDGIVALTKPLEEILISLGVKKDKICYAISGVKADFLQKIKYDKSIIRKKINLPLDGIIVIYTGSLYPRKGVEDTLYALKIIKEKNNHLYKKLYFLIVGGNLKEREFWTISALSDQLSIRKHVILRRFIPPSKLFDYIIASDIAIYTPRRTFYQDFFGGGGLKLWQYMLAGKPTILSRLKSTEDIVVDGVNCLLVEPQNPQAIADSIMRLIINPDLAQRIGKNAQEIALKEYTWEKRARKIIIFLKNQVLAHKIN